jgi:tetratricopeptide (TPR) repeat protein
MVVEDLHWLDPSTLELQQMLGEHGATVPLMLLYTARPEFRSQWIARPHHTEITVGRLNDFNVREMIAQVAARKALARERVDAVIERTGGVPLFVEELTRALLESGGVEHADGSIPATLHASLMARLDRLGAARDTLQLGAVLGTEFAYDLLLAVNPLSENVLQRHLLSLTDAELLYGRGRPPARSYQFRHALIRDAAYEALLKSRRRELHTRIARTMEERFPERAASQPEILAHHYTEAGLIAQAVDNWRKAGGGAIARSAYAEAIAHLTRGLQLLQRVPEDRRWQVELEFQVQLAVGLVGIKGWHDSEVGAAYQRANELWHGNDDDPRYFSILFGLWMNHLVRAEHREARGYAEQLVRIAPGVSERELEVQAYWALGCCQFYMGEFDRAHASFRRVIDSYDRGKHRSIAFRFGQDPCMSSMVLDSQVLWLLGYSDQSRVMDARAISLARSLKHPFTMAWCLTMLAMEDIEKRDFSRADERLGEGILLCRDCGFDDVERNLRDLRTIRLLLEGAVPEVRAEARSASQTRTKQGKGLHHPYGYTESAEALGRAKRFDKALPAVELALKLIGQSGERYWEAEARRIHGELLLAQLSASDRTALKEAESSLRCAIEIAHEQNARTLELRAITSLARVLRDTGRRDEAGAALDKIYNWFTEGFDTADLKDAKALLDELSA